MISRPIGNNEIGMSLKFAKPSGIPMMVRQSSTPETKCAIASHQPQSTNQMMLPMPDATPASARLTTVLPNGQRAKPAIRSEAMPKRNRDDQDEADQRGDRVPDRDPQAGENEPDDVEQDTHV